MSAKHNDKEFSIRILDAGDVIRSLESKRYSSLVNIGSEIRFNKSVLDTYTYDGWDDIHHDLMMVCAAVEYADRFQKRTVNGWCRNIKVTVPVRKLSQWIRSDVNESITDVLGLLTGDNWRFEFVKAAPVIESLQRQRSLPFEVNRQYAVAYSDGLDSRCVSGLHDSGGNVVRIRVAKNTAKIKRGDFAFDQIPFNVNAKGSKESSVRSRGFKFAAITAIAAQISQVKTILVPESGQGALGPVLVPLHNVYPDYRNHPSFFRKMEAFLRVSIGLQVRYYQPQIWSTKGQTVQAYVGSSADRFSEVSKTRSCWQQRWNVRVNGKLVQCGLCAACLLRRMSMHAAGVAEPRGTYYIENLGAPSFEAALPDGVEKGYPKLMVEYGSVGARHLNGLAGLLKRPESFLEAHSFEISRSLGESERDVSMRLLGMLRQHDMEWRSFIDSLGDGSFIGDWLLEGAPWQI